MMLVSVRFLVEGFLLHHAPLYVFEISCFRSSFRRLGLLMSVLSSSVFFLYLLLPSVVVLRFNPFFFPLPGLSPSII